MSHFVVALVGGVPEGGSRGLLLVRHHPQQLLNLEAAAPCSRTLEQQAPLGLGKGGAV